MDRQIKKILKALKTMRDKKKQVEGIHDFRVASRRWQAMLQLYPEKILAKPILKFQPKIRDFRKRLGKVREFDVHLGLWKQMAQGEVGDASIQKELQQGRQQLWKKVLMEVDFQKIKKFSQDLPEPPAFSPKQKGKRIKGQVLGHLEEIFRCHQKYRQRKEMEAMHQLRIHLKKLRYAWELWCTDGLELGKDFLPKLKEMQEALGALHDLETLAEHLKNLKPVSKKSWDSSERALIQKVYRRASREMEGKLAAWEQGWGPREKWLNSLRDIALKS